VDAKRFDRLTIRLAMGQARRDVLRGAMLAAAGLALGKGGAAAQAECPGGCLEEQVCLDGVCIRPCVKNRDCRDKHADPCILNQCLDGLCVQAIVDCVPGYECCDGSCCPVFCESDEACAVLDPCRWGRCGVDGRCEFIEADPCVVCASDLECQDGGPNTVCCGGACRRPCPTGTVMGKGCECRADASGVTGGLVIRDDASG
jgi:hypothetical protein